MVAVAYNLPDPFLEPPADLSRVDDILEVMAGHFAALLEERLSRGLYRAYVEEDSNVSMVRGRIVIAEDVRLNHILRHRTYCRYTEYSWNVPENQVLRQVVRLLAGYTFGPALRHRLRSIDAVMEDITPGRYVAADLERFTHNRLNADYRPLHRLCRLFLEAESLSDAAGLNTFRAFLIDMNRLFEAFITCKLFPLMPAPYTVHSQRSATLDDAGQVPMRPDIVVRNARDDVLVADCKYKRIEMGQYRQHDVYQVLAYCMALRVPVGLLIYPEHLAPVRTTMTVRHAGTFIAEISINLGGDLDKLHESCEGLTRSVFNAASNLCLPRL
jgi:5-methylcytosine-specific restriction enzyme subunit McrC